MNCVVATWLALVLAALVSQLANSEPTPDPSSEMIDLFIPPVGDAGDQSSNSGRVPARVVKRADDAEELMSVFLAGREEIIVGFFDPPVTTVVNSHGEDEDRRKMNEDNKYKWWHRICHNSYNKQMSFVITSNTSLAHYYGMLPYPHNPSTLYFKEESPNYNVYRPRFFEDGQLSVDTDQTKRLGQLVPDIFQIGGWKFVPTDAHGRKMKMLREHLEKLSSQHNEL